jgi:hypothetical protein
MKKLVQLMKQILEAWTEARLAYARRYQGHQMGS